MLGNSLFGDELSTYSIVTGHSPGQILHILNGHSVDLTPPLFFELAWLSSRLGRTPELLRLFPFLAGVCAVPLTYRLGLRTVGRGAALVLIAVGAAAAAISAVFTAGRARGRRLPSSRAVLPWLLGLATPVGLAAYSSVEQSAWDGRNLISSWPGAALAAGALLTSPRPPLRLLTVGAVVAGFAIGAVQLLSPADQRPDYAAAAALIRANGSPHDPVAVIPAPSPGPYTAMDGALAYAGDPGRPLLRIASAQLPQVLAAPPYAFLPETPASRLAAMTEAQSGSGKVFVVVPGTATEPQLRRSGVIDAPLVLGPLFGTGTPGRLYSTVFVPLSAYLRALAPRYRLVSTRRLNGFLPLSVYVLAAR